jgi:hypothetical protein
MPVIMTLAFVVKCYSCDGFLLGLTFSIFIVLIFIISVHFVALYGLTCSSLAWLIIAKLFSIIKAWDFREIYKFLELRSLLPQLSV